MSTLHRRLLRLETIIGRHVFRDLSDNELDNRLRAELAEWLRSARKLSRVDPHGDRCLSRR